MKVGNVRFKSLLIGLLIILLCYAGGTMAWAGISKEHAPCVLCHDGPPTLKGGYQGNEGCINCHSSSESSTQKPVCPLPGRFNSTPTKKARSVGI